MFETALQWTLRHPRKRLTNVAYATSLLLHLLIVLPYAKASATIEWHANTYCTCKNGVPQVSGSKYARCVDKDDLNTTIDSVTCPAGKTISTWQGGFFGSHLGFHCK